MKSKLILFLLNLLCLSCASVPSDVRKIWITDDEYEVLIDNNSRLSQQYDGPYNLFEISATILNSTVIDGITKKEATLYQWNDEKYASEIEKKKNASFKVTDFFVSIFTPDGKSSNLIKSASLWRPILKSGGREYVGSIKKIKSPPVELKSYYPKYNQWSNPYLISFEVPTSEVEQGEVEFILTGPIGASALKFNSNLKLK